MRFHRYRVAPALLLTGLLLSWTPRSLVAQHPPVVRGRVVEESTGQPVAGARIQLLDGTAETLSAHDGAFLLRGLLPGIRRLGISALGYADRTVTVEARNGRVTALRIELRPAPLDIPGLDVLAGPPDSLPPGAVVLDAPAIRRSGARDVGELLSSVAGISITREGGPGAPARASIRGSSADEVLVLLDGVPVNSPVTGAADLSALPLTGVERVVVLKGGSSARHGAGALGGVILLEGGPSPATELSAWGGAGSFGERRARLEAGGKVEGPAGLAGAVTAAWSRIRGDFEYPRPRSRGGGDARRTNADASRATLRATGEWRPLSGTILRARLEALELERGMPGPVVQPSGTGRQSQSRYGAVLSASNSRRHGDWRVALHLQRQDARFRDPDPPFGPAFDESTRVDGVGLAATAVRRAGLLRWEAGMEGRGFQVHATSLASHRHRQGVLGAWISARFAGEPAKGWRLGGGPGIRVDWSSELRGPWASPRLGVSLGRGPVTARLAVSSSFSPPSLSDQFFQEGVLVRPNPELRPERVRPEIEGGLDLETGLGPGRLSLTVEAFRADVEGMILWFPDHRFVWSPRNVNVTRRGVELRARALLPRPGIELEGALTRTAVRYDGPVLDGQVIYRPGLTADVGLRWSTSLLRGELDARYTGARRTVPGSALNSLEPFWMLDLRLGRALRLFGGHLEAWARAENLLDVRAATIPDHPHPGRAWGFELRASPFRSRP